MEYISHNSNHMDKVPILPLDKPASTGAGS